MFNFDTYRNFAVKYSSSFYSKHYEYIFIKTCISREDFIQLALLYLHKFLEKLENGFFHANTKRKVQFSKNLTKAQVNKLVGNALHYEFLHIKRDAFKYTLRFVKLQQMISKIRKKQNQEAVDIFRREEKQEYVLSNIEKFIRKILQDKEYDIFYKRAVENKTFKVISEELDINVATTWFIYSDAHKKIRNALKIGGADEAEEIRNNVLFNGRNAFGRN